MSEDFIEIGNKKLLALFEAIAGEDEIANISEISLFANKLKSTGDNNDNISSIRLLWE